MKPAASGGVLDESETGNAREESSPFSAPQISLPKGGGAIRDEFERDGYRVIEGLFARIERGGAGRYLTHCRTQRLKSRSLKRVNERHASRKPVMETILE